MSCRLSYFGFMHRLITFDMRAKLTRLIADCIGVA